MSTKIDVVLLRGLLATVAAEEQKATVAAVQAKVRLRGLAEAALPTLLDVFETAQRLVQIDRNGKAAGTELATRILNGVPGDPAKITEIAEEFDRVAEELVQLVDNATLTLMPSPLSS